MGVTLPPEILTIICELCTSPPGLCNTRSCGDRSISFCCVKKACMVLRLVSREWNAVSTPFVFDDIKLRLFPPSVEKFNRLCDSELAKHVSTLDFHPDLLPVWEKETWLSNVLHSEPDVEGRVKHRLTGDFEAYDEATRQSLSTEELDAGWAAYEKHMSGQRRWHNHLPDLQTMLEHALLRLPNLCRTTVACCSSSYQLRHNLFSAFAQEPFLKILAREIIVPAKTWLVSLTPELSNRKHVELEDACSLAYLEAIGHRSQHPGAKQVKDFTFDLKSQQTLSMLSAASKHAAGVSGGFISRPKDLLQAYTETRI